jgi:tetratricopeptide (TPR) repeat protein
MAKNPERLPKRSRAHVIEKIALDRFNALCPPEWVVNESKSDYGWDLFIGLATKGVVQPEDFFVQLKGSEKPDYINEGTLISFALKTSTINWLLGKPNPSMLAICDTGHSDQPVYWVWLNDAVPRLIERKADALSKKTLNIHIPVENVLIPSARQKIEGYVVNFHADRNIGKRIADFILPSLGHSAIDDPSQYRDSPGSFLKENIGPWVRAGIVEAGESEDANTLKAMNPEDQQRFQALRDVQNALRELRERDALEQLEALKDEIEKEGSDYIKNIYHRTKGSLFQHMYRLPEAAEQYKVALQLRPKDLHCEADLLHVEFALAFETGHLEKALPGNWTERVDEVLAKLPEECRLIRLKAVLIGYTKSPKEAEDFLRNSVSWEREQKETLGYIAHIHCWAGELDAAERTLDEAQGLGTKFDAVDWSLCGYVYLKKALGVTGPKIDSPVYGAGPASLDLVSLKRAAEAYEKAYRFFGGKGFPTVSEETVVNFTVVLRLLDKIDQGIRICNSYLDQNPDSAPVHSALAGFLVLADKAADALPSARRAFDADPTSSLAFKSLAASLCQAEEYEELLMLIEGRRLNGFYDKDEEGLSFILVVIACTEKGDLREAEKWVKHLESDQELRRHAPIAKATLYLKLGIDKDEVYRIFHKALDEYPHDLHLLTHFVGTLLPLREETAPEIISCLETARALRQLTSREYHLLAKAFLMLKNADAADGVLAEGNRRYPEDPFLITEWVNAKAEIGDEEQAFQLLMLAMKKQGPDHNMLSDLAVLAANTGRLNSAIEFSEKAAGKTKDPKEQGIIQRHLYQLKRQRGDDLKETLRHVINFGKNIVNPEDEADYLIMFMSTPKPKDADDDVEAWGEDFRSRLAKFTAEHPNFEGLKSIKIPDGVPDDRKGLYLRAELWAVLLPHELATAPLWQTARVTAWPLVFRSSHIPSASIFDYFSTCLQSQDFADAIHFFSQGNDLHKEAIAASKSEKVCVDLTALLTLAELNSLDLLARSFEIIVIARGTRHAIWTKTSPILGIHPLAQKISDWIEANQRKIRVRHAGTEIQDIGEALEYGSSAAGILTERRSISLNIVLPDGIGESLMLAEKLGIPLYSDESCIRVWAADNRQTASFSTLGFGKSLVEKGIWSINQEVDLITDLIKRNYRWVPFSPLHLNARLRLIVDSCRIKGIPVSSDTLRQDERMWLLIRSFGESSINEGVRAQRAVQWWLSIVESDSFDRCVLAACMNYPTNFIVTASKTSVIIGKISKYEREEKAAKLLAPLLWASYVRCERHLAEVWLAVKDAVENLFPNRELLVFARMPKKLLDAANSENSFSPAKKTGFLVDLISRLPQEDRGPFERHLTENAKKIT